MERNMGARIVLAKEIDFRSARWPVPEDAYLHEDEESP